MTIEISSISDNFSVAGQIQVTDLKLIAEQGFKSVINNRPDGEGGDTQPSGLDVQNAAKAAGLEYAHIPVINGQLTQEQVVEMAKLLDVMPKPILAFCRSGARSTNIYILAQQVS